MIKSILIVNSSGFPFYSRKVDPNFEEIDPLLFGGLISAISHIGKKLFNEDIATITYGEKFEITIITKDLFEEKKNIYFVFIVEGEPDLKLMRSISTNIFIETKKVLKDQSAAKLDIKEKVDLILANYEYPE